MGQTQEVGLHGFGVGRACPSLGLSQLVLEFVEAVVLPLACELIGRRQMDEPIGPQIEGKEMARGILDAIVRGGRIMRGSGVKVTVARRDLEAIQLRHRTPEVLRVSKKWFVVGASRPAVVRC